MIRAVVPVGGKEIDFVIDFRSVTVIAPPGFVRRSREFADLALALADMEASPSHPSYEILVRDHLAALLPGLETRQVDIPAPERGVIY
jgi:hypothetical protein